MKPILCYFRHNYCSYKIGGVDYVICQRCGKILFSSEDDEKYDDENEMFN